MDWDENGNAKPMSEKHRPPGLRRIFFTTLGFILISLVLLFGMFPFSLFYNNYLHPLGALDKSVEIGDQEEEVAAKFAAFAAEQSGIMAYYGGPAEGMIYGRNSDYNRAI